MTNAKSQMTHGKSSASLRLSEGSNAGTISDSSEHQLQRKLDLPRIDPRASDRAVGRGSQLIPRRAPDRVIWSVEDLCAEFQVFRFGQVELLVGRSVKADDARADDRVPRGVAVPEISGSGDSIDVGVGVEEPRARLLVARQVRIRSRGVGVAGAAAVLDIPRAAKDREWEAVLQGQDAAQLPPAEREI